MFELSYQERLAGTIAGNYQLSGDDIMCDALRWTQEHPVVWADIESEVRWKVMRKKRGRLQTIIYNVCDEREVKAPSKTLTAAFQRILMQRVPGYLDSFTVCKSKVDGVNHG